jgi:hypothetical protein
MSDQNDRKLVGGHLAAFAVRNKLKGNFVAFA